uniref:Zinc finger MYND-type containing 12 n=1 Tax=Terrapene triunguis TaxID=2587831 RepID=A0A674KE70_9SAUR
MNVQQLVPLALPRGRPLSCELCGGPAQLRCGACRVTYYCDVDHQKADWVSIHEKICQLLIPIRTSFPFFNSEKERKHGMEQLLHRKITAFSKLWLIFSKPLKRVKCLTPIDF